MQLSAPGVVATVVCALTYFGLARGKLPGLRADRAGIALIGAAVLLATGAVPFPEAVRAIDYGTLALLFGMMILVSFLQISGFFERVTAWVTGPRAAGPHALLAATIGVGGVLSAFLVNDVICLALTPLVIQVTRRLGLKPVPYLIALATAANIGSAGTIVGNPQNMIIGSLSRIPYARFAAKLLPIAIVGLVVDFLLIAWVFRTGLRDPDHPPQAKASDRAPPATSAAQDRLFGLSLAVLFATFAAFFAGFSLPVSSLAAAGALICLTRVRPTKYYRRIDWGLLVMFTGLFVVVHGFERAVLLPNGLDRIGEWDAIRRSPLAFITLSSSLLSNLVSNVPAVLLYKPVIPSLPGAIQDKAWLTLAMASTFAGNLTLLGSVANLIVVEGARRHGVRIGFWQYCRVGIPVTLLTLLIGYAGLGILK